MHSEKAFRKNAQYNPKQIFNNLDDDFDEYYHFDNNEAEGTNLSSDKLMKTLELDSKILKEVAINGFVSHFVCKDCGYQSARKWGVKRHLVSKHKIGH